MNSSSFYYFLYLHVCLPLLCVVNLADNFGFLVYKTVLLTPSTCYVQLVFLACILHTTITKLFQEKCRAQKLFVWSSYLDPQYYLAEHRQQDYGDNIKFCCDHEKPYITHMVLVERGCNQLATNPYPLLLLASLLHDKTCTQTQNLTCLKPFVATRVKQRHFKYALTAMEIHKLGRPNFQKMYKIDVFFLGFVIVKILATSRPLN